MTATRCTVCRRYSADSVMVILGYNAVDHGSRNFRRQEILCYMCKFYEHVYLYANNTS